MRRKKLNYDLIIVGGGAAGMMAAITAANIGKQVIILEKMDRLGKKILATGNGRCNFTNSYLDEACFRSSQSRFPYSSLEQFGYEDTLSFFEGLGIAFYDRDGYYYPRSNQATTVVNSLIYKIQSLKIPIILNCKITDMSKKKDCFVVSDGKKQWKAKNVLLTTGGKAQEKLGSDGSGYVLAKKMKHRVTPVFPALTALEIKNHPFKGAAGVRCRCQIDAKVDGKSVSKESGELQITKYGISGVLVFQISRYLIAGMREKKEAEILIDFLPEQENKERFFERMQAFSSYKTALQWLEGYFPSLLAKALLKNAKVEENRMADKLSKQEKTAIWTAIKKCSLIPCAWKEFDFAQVTAGGVSVKNVSPYTMESDLVKGLYFAGEILDVDGTCGGYNLQWAWTSGYLAGRSIE